MIERLEAMLADVPDCELRRCARKAVEMWHHLDDVAARLRDLDRCVFQGFGMQDVPGELVEGDYDAALALIETLAAVQATMRRGLFERFGLRCIVGRAAEPYDEHSPRFAAASARPTGNPALDWHVADTVARGYEWDGTPGVLLPARVDVYRYDEDGPQASIDAVEPALVPSGRLCELRLRGSGLAHARHIRFGDAAADLVEGRGDGLVVRVTIPDVAGWVDIHLDCDGDDVSARDALWAYRPLDCLTLEGAELWGPCGRVAAVDDSEPWIEARRRHEVLVRGIMVCEEERVLLRTRAVEAAPPAEIIPSAGGAAPGGIILSAGGPAPGGIIPSAGGAAPAEIIPSVGGPAPGGKIPSAGAAASGGIIPSAAGPAPGGKIPSAEDHAPLLTISLSDGSVHEFRGPLTIRLGSPQCDPVEGP